MLTTCTNSILNLLYPPRCLFCKVTISNQQIFLCDKCKDDMPLIADISCKLCGKSIENSSYSIKKNTFYDNLCPLCYNADRFFEQAICAFEYIGKVKNGLLKCKFFGDAKILKPLVFFLAERIKIKINIEEFDIITCVPLHQNSLNIRGFNQSYLIANELGKLLNILHVPNLLLKLSENKTQSSLHRNERFQNVENIFTCDNNLARQFDITNKNILLVDDILTTGATLNECAKVLCMAGATKIVVATIATGMVNNFDNVFFKRGNKNG